MGVDNQQLRIEMLQHMRGYTSRSELGGGVLILDWQIGVILHQPLNLSIFRKKAKNGQNMNGIPVCLGRKTENAPTWRPPSPLFWGLFSTYFQAFWIPPPPIPLLFSYPPSTIQPPQRNIFIFIFCFYFYYY